MFTVVIADCAFLAHMQKYLLFLQPFIDKGGFALCEWNPLGKTVPEMLPDIYDIVGRHTEWRAIVLAPSDDFDIKRKNPFDVVRYAERCDPDDHSPKRAELRKRAYEQASRSALTRLGIYLSETLPYGAFLNLSGKSDKTKDAALSDFSTHDSSNRGHSPKQEDPPKSVFKLKESDEYLEFITEREVKRTLIETFYSESDPCKHLLVPAPTELYFITPREFDNAAYDMALSAEDGEDTEYSSFAQYNMYPASARFIVYDLCESKHAQYEYDFVCFLEFLLAFAANDMPQSKMRPERVYRAVCKNDFHLLSDLFFRYEKKLAATEVYLRNIYAELADDCTKTLSDEIINSRYCSDIIIGQPAVASENAGFNLNLNAFGIFGRPNYDIVAMDGIYHAAKLSMKECEKKTFRAIEQLSESTRVQPVEYGEMPNKLTSAQLSDVRGFADERKRMLASMPILDTIDSSGVRRTIEKAKENVVRELACRVTSKKFIFALAYSLFAVVVGSILFLTDESGIISSLFAVTIMLYMFGAVVLTAVIFLLLSRIKLRRTLNDFAVAVRSYFDACKSYAVNYSLRLSRICEIARSYEVMAFSEEGKAQRLERAYIIKKHIIDLANVRNSTADIFGKFKSVESGNEDSDDSLDNEPFEYDFTKPVTYEYPLPFAESDVRKIRFMGVEMSGEIPIGFISEVDVIREEIL
ncbi:MAG: hypothetical protein LBD85_05635 [Oscillospiraceae bacterium]|jgi:hypothetical protein|nr:hypothetical protein [Oscillospiraceae bacterium]